MAKPLPERVPSDDCAVQVGGVVCYPHEGEWVEVFRCRSVAETFAQRSLLQLGSQWQAARDAPDEALRVTALMQVHFEAVLKSLAERVTDWNWTDLRGRPLPEPSIEVLRELSTAEVQYLLGIIRGESPAEGKGGSQPSRTTSSESTVTGTGPGRSRKRAGSA